MKKILEEARACTVCSDTLSHGARPVLEASVNSKIVIIGQAPGIKVHNSGIPWDDKSGERLREWLGVDSETFYNKEIFAIIPMGFCYPGKGKSGDLPPKKICAPLWHEKILEQMKSIELILLIGKHAQDYYLPNHKKTNLTKKVMDFHEYLPEYFVLPHPSPLNNIWHAKNRWFEEDVVPYFRNRVQEILSTL